MACAWTECLDCGFIMNNVTLDACWRCNSENVVKEQETNPRVEEIKDGIWKTIPKKRA